MEIKILESLKPDVKLIGMDTLYIKAAESYKIKAEMKLKGITIYRAAKDLGIKPNTIRDIVRNNRNYTSENLFKLKLYLGLISPEEVENAILLIK